MPRKPAEKEDVDVFVPMPAFVNLANGEKKQLPKMTWGREIRVLKVIKNIMAEIVKSGVFNNAAKVDEEGNPVPMTEEEIIAQNTEATSKIMDLIFELGPKELTEAASAITDESAEWVQENMNVEGIIEIVVPFLRSKQDSIMKVLKPYLQNAA